MRTPASVLAALGDSSTAVAEALRRAGVTGRRHSPTACPLARYLVGLAELRLRVAHVDHPGLYVRRGGGAYQYAGDLPAACDEFVARFDKGEFPDLAAEGRRP